MTAHFKRIFDMYISQHRTNPKPNMILFGTIGSACGIYNGIENELATQTIYKKLDMNDSQKSAALMTFGTMQGMVTGGALGLTYGFFAGPVLVALLGAGLAAKGCKYVFDTAEKILVVS